MDPSTRRLSPEDWRILADLRLRALADAPDAFGAVLVDAEAKADDVWREQLRGVGPVVVATEGDRPVAMGGAFVSPGSRVAHLWGMWTAPEARGRGHGARVLVALLAWCRDHGLGVELDVTEGNGAARALYLAHGFRPTGDAQPLRPGSELRCESMRIDSS